MWSVAKQLNLVFYTDGRGVMALPAVLVRGARWSRPRALELDSEGFDSPALHQVHLIQPKWQANDRLM